jgi:hypothetical protein
MGLITSIRAPLPVAETTPPAPEPRKAALASLSAADRVADTTLVRAVQHAPTKPASGKAHLLEARMTVDTHAAAAAKAARDAYIEASIAAGISPLPLP